MPISLNSPKYADVNSLAYQMHKKQQNRKRRKNPFVPELFERHFRRNEGTTDYATIPEVALAGDFRIVFDLLTTDSGAANVIIGNSASATPNIRTASSGVLAYNLPTGGSGSIVINDGIFHNVIIELIGTTLTIDIDGVNDVSVTIAPASITFDVLYRNTFGNYFAGIIANLKIYDAGTLVRDYKLNDNTSILADSASGEDGTVINGNASDWGLFQQQTTGEWLGQELVTDVLWLTPSNVGSQWLFASNQWTLTGDGSANALSILPTADNPDVMRLTGNLVSLTGVGLSVANNLSEVITTTGLYIFDMNKSDIGVFQYLRSSGVVNATIDKPSLKEVLNVA